MAKHSLFRSDIEPRCAYCARGNPLSEDQVACRKYGVVSGGFHCRRFRYDPLRRIPLSCAPTFCRSSFCSCRRRKGGRSNSNSIGQAG